MSTTTFRLKRSSVAGKIPTTSQLELGEIAVNTYDGKAYIKKSVAGEESVVEIGAGDVGGQSYAEYYFSADSGDTTFTGADDNGETLAYTPALSNVYLNGILLDSDQDYTGTDGSTITLATALDSGDILQVQSFSSKLQIAEYEYTATASQTTFSGQDNAGRTLDYKVGKVEVYLNGVLLDPKIDYTATTGTSIVLTIGAAVNDHIQVITLPDFQPTKTDYKPFYYSFAGQSGVTSISGADSDGNTLAYNVGSLKVLKDGVLMSAVNDYSAIDGQTITFSAAIDSSDSIEIQAFNKSADRPAFEDVRTEGGVFIGGTTDEYLLGQYRQKAFTPAISGSSSAGTGNYTTQVGHYVRTGHMVNFTVQLVWTTHTGTGNLLVTGLPFTSQNTTGLHYTYSVAGKGDLTYTDGDTVNAVLENNSTQLKILTEDGAGNNGAVSMTGNGSGRVLVTGQYFVS